MTSFLAVQKEIHNRANPEKAQLFQRFFKTGKGEYGEGDMFVGLTVPQSRKIAQQYIALTLPELQTLLQSKIHEERLIALLILIHNFEKKDEKVRKQIYNLYLSHTKYINNWDLVDLSAPKIVGAYLLDKPRTILYKLAKSNSLWERRIAVIATLIFIVKRKENTDTFAIAEILLNDTHDLIHKAVGWMLREVGKHISQETEEEFLKSRYKKMPRTMLRYAIEHFSEKKRQMYLKGKI